MKKCFIFLCCIFGLSLTLKATELCLLELPIRGTNVVFVALYFDTEFKSFIDKNNIAIEEAEDLLISYINQKPDNISENSYNPKGVLADLPKISKSNKVEQYIDTIIRSEKTKLYSSAINSFLWFYSYNSEALTKIEEYIKLTDKSSDYRRTRFYVSLSYAIETNDTLSVEMKFQIIKLMLKYLTYDLHNWHMLDRDFCEKIPSYRHSIQRKNMIEYIQSKEANLTEWYKGELSKINEDFNIAIKENPLIDLSDEIIREEIKTYKCTKYEVWEI